MLGAHGTKFPIRFPIAVAGTLNLTSPPVLEPSGFPPEQKTEGPYLRRADGCGVLADS
jgi:hypothetical protein